jgi:hypothetical protein
MLVIEKFILKTYGHSYDALGLLTIPTLVFTLMIAACAFLVTGKEVFWFGVWCVAGIAQAVGVMWARTIRFKYNMFD